MKQERKSASHALWLFTLISILSLSGKPYNANGEEWMFKNILSQENNLSPYRDSSRNDILTLENSSAGIQDLFFNKLFLPLLVKNHKPGNNLLMRCEQGLFHSANGGDHWKQISTISGYLITNDLGNPGQVLWARPDGLWKSQDQGESWKFVGTFGAAQGVTVAQLATTSTVPNAMYISFINPPGASTWPFYSLDGGLSWNAVKTAPWDFPNIFVNYGQEISVALAPRAGQPVPVRLITTASAHPWSGTYSGDLYRSGDYGATWSQMNFLESFPLPGGAVPWLFFHLVASPVNPNLFYLTNYYITSSPRGDGIAGRLFTSTDGGINWTDISPASWTSKYEVAASAILPERVYARGYWSWYQSDDGGRTWISKDFPTQGTLPLENLVLDSQNPACLYGYYGWSGTTYEYKGMTSYNGGTTWHYWAEQPCGSSFQQLLSP
jgi:hypothetical protein